MRVSDASSEEVRWQMLAGTHPWDLGSRLFQSLIRADVYWARGRQHLSRLGHDLVLELVGLLHGLNDVARSSARGAHVPTDIAAP